MLETNTAFKTSSVLDVFTDGSCLGNPGRGGWAYVVDGGPWACGFEPNSTNQRMEIAAAAHAVADLEGPLRVNSDSSYVVKCFNDEWWKGWHRRNWLNTARKPVANRDLWEPFIDEVLSRGNVTFAWVKAHAGQRLNSAADLLAVHAASASAVRSGKQFSDAVLDQIPDNSARPSSVAGREAGEVQPPDVQPSMGASDTASHNKAESATLSREIAGHAVAVLGHRPPELGGYGDTPITRRLLRQLSDVLSAKRQVHSELVVATGLGLGAEMLGAEAALAAGVPFVAVLAFDGVEQRWPGPSRQRFAELRSQAVQEVVLSTSSPVDGEAFGKAMRRRDTWLMRNCDEAILIRNEGDRTLGELQRRLEEALDDVWVIEPE